ncbi:MAG: hypothetical protein M4579_007590 [Chaenotheca gracillima]|nr:MAG: hypothetical protein M4579_007590 [Chaenotheca gracillima]
MICRVGVNSIGKYEFIQLYGRARERAFTSHNIKAAFRGAGLVPFNPHRVLRLASIPNKDVPGTPTHMVQFETVLTTPRTMPELQTYMDAIDPELLNTPINNRITKVHRALEYSFTQNQLLQDELDALHTANNAKQKRKNLNRLQGMGRVLTMGDADQAIFAANMRHAAKGKKTDKSFIEKLVEGSSADDMGGPAWIQVLAHSTSEIMASQPWDAWKQIIEF